MLVQSGDDAGQVVLACPAWSLPGVRYRNGAHCQPLWSQQASDQAYELLKHGPSRQAW